MSVFIYVLTFVSVLVSICVSIFVFVFVLIFVFVFVGGRSITSNSTWRVGLADWSAYLYRVSLKKALL